MLHARNRSKINRTRNYHCGVYWFCHLSRSGLSYFCTSEVFMLCRSDIRFNRWIERDTKILAIYHVDIRPLSLVPVVHVVCCICLNVHSFRTNHDSKSSYTDSSLMKFVFFHSPDFGFGDWNDWVRSHHRLYVDVKQLAIAAGTKVSNVEKHWVANSTAVSGSVSLSGRWFGLARVDKHYHPSSVRSSLMAVRWGEGKKDGSIETE